MACKSKKTGKFIKCHKGAKRVSTKKGKSKARKGAKRQCRKNGKFAKCGR